MGREIDVEATGYPDLETLIESMRMDFALLEHSYSRSLAGTILHLVGDSQWVYDYCEANSDLDWRDIGQGG